MMVMVIEVTENMKIIVLNHFSTWFLARKLGLTFDDAKNVMPRATVAEARNAIQSLRPDVGMVDNNIKNKIIAGTKDQRPVQYP